jgi:hypothetical protein
MYAHGLSIYIPGGEGTISSSREQNTELSDSLMILHGLNNYIDDKAL